MLAIIRSLYKSRVTLKCINPNFHASPLCTKPFLVVCGGLLANFISALSIVGVNKYIYVHYGFPNLSLTCLHFVVTFAGLLACLVCRTFAFKRLPWLQMLPIALTFCGFVVFTNLSLQFNTVGTYQLMKTLTTPCVMVIETLRYAKHFPWAIRLTFVPVILGVLTNSYYDVKFNLTGTLFALVGVLVTSLYQILVGAKQSELSANSMQLLLYQAPLSALVLIGVIPFCEPLTGAKGVFSASWTAGALAVVFLSGFIAFLVNLTTYWIIGTTSPLTYNMFGHSKFCAAMLLGYFVFHDPISLLQLAGILLTLSGVLLYSYLKLKAQQANTMKSQKLPR